MKYREQFINETRGYSFGDSGYMTCDYDLSWLYKYLRSEYGKATKMYRDRKDHPPHRVGWVFTKRMEYEDWRPGQEDRYYIREVWVEVVFENDEVNPCGGPVIKAVYEEA
jgi:hypothetical protein